MTPQNTVDIKGNFDTHPFAEILAEISQAKLSGSLRLARGEKKTIIYIRDGQVVYAVSNARSFRLFSALLQSGKINHSITARFPNFASDKEFGDFLVAERIMTIEAVRAATVAQVKEIIIDALVWPDADWVFSPLARLRADLVYEVDISKMLIEYARCLTGEKVFERFKSVNEVFAPSKARPSDVLLESGESKVFAMFAGELTISQLKSRSGMPDSALYNALYALWLGGILCRQNWHAAFSSARLDHLRNVKLSLVKAQSKAPYTHSELKKETETQSHPADQASKIIVAEITLEEYLARVEGAETHYDIMGVAKNAAVAEIKASYLMMAKLFHPDHYHREAGELLRRVQIAFTEMAQAYEILKTPETRESYDYKMRKLLEARDKRRAEGMPEMSDAEQSRSEGGAESFEAGLNHLVEQEYGPAATQFARAVHSSPQNAMYHAYYGQALSFLEKFQHKAEAEMLEAVRLDPKNAKIRLTLTQFFIDRNMMKRAEGELNRFLQIVPENKEAKDLLRSLQT